MIDLIPIIASFIMAYITIKRFVDTKEKDRNSLDKVIIFVDIITILAVFCLMYGKLTDNIIHNLYTM